MEKHTFTFFRSVALGLSGAALALLLQPGVALMASVPSCQGVDATIWVDGTSNHIMNGATDTGVLYAGTLSGTPGNDVIVGTGGPDIINGNGGQDTICSGNGNDTITVTDAANIISLGDGSNTVTAGNGNNTITGGSGNNQIHVGDGGNLIALGSGANHIVAGNGSNTTYTGDGNDEILVGNGNNTIGSGGGNDAITANGGGTNTIDGGAGTDYCSASATSTLSNCEATGATGIITIAAAGTATGIGGTAFTGGLGAFTLAAGTSSAFSVANGSYDVTETVPTGFSLDSMRCSGNATTNLAGATAHIVLATGGSVSCTFTTSQPVTSSSSSSSSDTSSSVASSSSSSSSSDASSVASSSSSSSDSSVSSASEGSQNTNVSSGTSDEAFTRDPGSSQGGHRGEGVSRVLAALTMLADRMDLTGTTPPPAFGGSSAQPLSTDAVSLVCGAHKLMGAAVSDGFIQVVTGMLTTKLGFDAQLIEKQFKNPNLCPQTTASASTSSAPAHQIAMGDDGYPLSKNPTWNACVRGTATLEDMRANPDTTITRSGVVIHRDCASYRNTGTNDWTYPDDAFLTITITPPSYGAGKPTVTVSNVAVVEHPDESLAQ